MRSSANTFILRIFKFHFIKAERQKYNVKVLPRWPCLNIHIIGIHIHRPKSYNYVLNKVRIDY